LRIAPADAAIVLVVQNGRDHHRDLLQSPFAVWFPSTEIGKKVLASPELSQLRDSATMIFRELDTTPGAIIDDILGDAVAFAFTPAPADHPKDERAVILIRPRDVGSLEKVLDKVNALQSKSGEVKSFTRKEHAGSGYFERVKSDGRSEFYCFRGNLFAFSTSREDILGVIDRDKTAPAVAEKSPVLRARMERLGVADAAAVILINPRPLDAEVAARVASAKPDEKRFLARFAEVWSALDSAALSLTLNTELEIGLSVRFQSEKLPEDLKKWFGSSKSVALTTLIPNDALVGVSGRLRAMDLIGLITSIAPVEAGKPSVKDWIEMTLGPVVGRDKLPLVLGVLGPNWAAWAEAPAKDALLPTFVGAVELSGTGEERVRAQQTLVQGIEFGFQMLRISYNSRHTDQIELREEKDPKSGVVIRSLVNEKGFPPGFSPSFAIVKNYLVLATSPEAIRRFVPTAADSANPSADRILGRLSGTRARQYLQTNGEKLTRFLVEIGATKDEAKTRETLAALASALELIDSAELIARPDENGLRLAGKIKPAKPLKK